MARLISLGLLAAVLVAVFSAPAQSQFGQIFGGPPRPPADVPGRPSVPAPLGLPQQLPPEEMDEDAPPPGARPLPIPPPANRAPPQGAVRTQPLAPPPGAASAPPRPAVPPSASLSPGQQVPPIQQGATPPGQPRGTPQPADTAPQPTDEVITELPSQKIPNPTAVFAGLDKITGRIIAFDVALNETVQFGALQVTPRVCYTRPPTENANTDSFVEVDEVTLQGEVKRLFAGWMFAASPGLHAVEHPIYDVWLTDCKGGTTVVADTAPEPAAPAPKQPLPRRSSNPSAPRQAVQQPTLQQPQAPPPPFGLPPLR
jgi:hypothetical protein